MAKYTTKRITLNLSKQNHQDVEKLQEHFGESYSDVIKRAITLLALSVKEDASKKPRC